jgi:hypothetical protein
MNHSAPRPTRCLSHLAHNPESHVERLAKDLNSAPSSRSWQGVNGRPWIYHYTSMVVTKRDNAAGVQPNPKVEWLEGSRLNHTDQAVEYCDEALFRDKRLNRMGDQTQLFLSLQIVSDLSVPAMNGFDATNLFDYLRLWISART